jgi:hypothetical protein
MNLDFPLRYIGQMGRTFIITHKEHIHAFRKLDSNSECSNLTHMYGTITDTMDVIRTGRKDRHLNTMEKCYLYKISKKDLDMNDTYILIF